MQRGQGWRIATPLDSGRQVGELSSWPGCAERPAHSKVNRTGAWMRDVIWACSGNAVRTRTEKRPGGEVVRHRAEL